MTSNPDNDRSFWLYVAAHGLCFALWVLPAVVGVRLAREFGLHEVTFGLFVAMPILVGSLVRLPVSAAADRCGSRTMMTAVMMAGAVSVLALSFVQSYWQALVAATGVGIAGGSFAVGITFVSDRFSEARAPRALDWLGSGVAGAALAFIVGDAVPDWRLACQLAGLTMLAAAALFLSLASYAPRGNGVPTRRLQLQQFAPLQKVQVLRFSLYYFFVFGGFVALIVWLPHYVAETYDATFNMAARIGCAVALVGGFGRVYGAKLVRDYGARRVLYWTFFVAVAVTFILSYPSASYSISTTGGDVVVQAGLGIASFSVLITLLALFLSFGQAAVYAHIPVYYPRDAAVVGAIAGMVGGLGGFVLPVMFALLAEMTDIHQSAFMLLFALVAVALLWMHLAILRMEHRAATQVLKDLPAFPELSERTP